MYKSEDEIKRDMLSRISNTIDTSQNSLIHDAVSPVALELAIMYMGLEYTQSQFDIEELEGENLDRFIHSRTGLERKQATYATGIVIVSGQEGAAVKKGDLVSNGNVDFEITENKTIGSSGRIEVKIKAIEPGIISNVSVDSVNQFLETLPGVIEVYNPQTIINGRDEEADEEFQERYFNKLRRPGKAGNKYHYEEWASEVDGVGGVQVIPKHSGPLTVKVILIDNSGLPANEDLISNVANHIDNEKPFGAEVTVVAAKSVPINVTVKVDASVSNEEIKENVEKRLIEYLRDIAFRGNYVSYAQVGNVVLTTPGIKDYENLKINNKTENITIGKDEVATIGGVVIE